MSPASADLPDDADDGVLPGTATGRSDSTATDAGTGPSADLVRRRRIRRIAGSGILLGVVLALAAGGAGATGQAGAAIMLLLSAAGCAVAATYGVLTALVDDLRGRAVSRRRLLWIVLMFVGAAGLMAMTAGVGG